MDLLTFLQQSPTAFQTVETVSSLLREAGAMELKETDAWKIAPGKLYYVTRNGSALIAFAAPEDALGFRIFACHGDSPTYKIKENPEIVVENQYVKLNTEPYGGMIAATWFDRPLSVAGRVIVIENGKPVSKYVNVDRDLLLIPHLAIHQDREVNKGFAPNPQQDLAPLFGTIGAKGKFMEIVAEAAGVRADEIVAHDLFLYVRQKPTVWGSDGVFLSAQGIDDRECVYAGIKGFLQGKKTRFLPVFALFDNEEVGSASRQGAASTFLLDTVKRISSLLCDSEETYQRRIADSFMLSADNGHALHPNHPEKCDPTNRPVLNGGVLLKFSANQKYTTDAETAAEAKALFQEAGVPYQLFFNRSDVTGGSTLGNLSTLQVPFRTADIGLAQIAMHSAYETTGMKDVEALVKVAETLYQ